MSTLLEELEEAMRETTCTDPMCLKRERPCSRNERAARLRKRIEHVKRLRNEMPSQADVELFDALTRDLP